MRKEVQKYPQITRRDDAENTTRVRGGGAWKEMNGALPILAPREQEEPCRGTREDHTRGRAGKKNRQAQSSRKGRVNNSTTTEGNTDIKSDAGGESAETLP